MIPRREICDCAFVLLLVLATFGLLAKWNLHQLSVWQSDDVGAGR